MKDTPRPLAFSRAFYLSPPAMAGSLDFFPWLCESSFSLCSTVNTAVNISGRQDRERHHNSPSVLPAEGSHGLCSEALPPSLSLNSKTVPAASSRSPAGNCFSQRA